MLARTVLPASPLGRTPPGLLPSARPARKRGANSSSYTPLAGCRWPPHGGAIPNIPSLHTPAGLRPLLGERLTGRDAAGSPRWGWLGVVLAGPIRPAGLQLLPATKRGCRCCALAVSAWPGGSVYLRPLLTWCARLGAKASTPLVIVSISPWWPCPAGACVLLDRSGAPTAVELGLACWRLGLFSQLGPAPPSRRPEWPYRRPRTAVSYVQVPLAALWACSGSGEFEWSGTLHGGRSVVDASCSACAGRAPRRQRGAVSVGA